jgi:hypothetical protein
MKALVIPALRNFILGVIALGVVLFLPAQTLNYWQAWVFIMVFMVLLSVSTAYFSIKDPALIERRKQAGPAAEQTTGQKIFIFGKSPGDRFEQRRPPIDNHHRTV